MTSARSFHFPYYSYVFEIIFSVAIDIAKYITPDANPMSSGQYWGAGLGHSIGIKGQV